MLRKYYNWHLKLASYLAQYTDLCHGLFCSLWTFHQRLILLKTYERLAEFGNFESSLDILTCFGVMIDSSRDLHGLTSFGETDRVAADFRWCPCTCRASQNHNRTITWAKFSSLCVIQPSLLVSLELHCSQWCRSRKNKVLWIVTL